MSIISNECPPTVRAMTCHGPFAYALALGIKQEEYRRRDTKYRGWVLIHCGLSTASDDAFEYLDLSPSQVERGGIIGASYLNASTKDDDYYAYQMITPVKFPKLIRISGKQATLWQPSNTKEVQIFADAWQILQRMIIYCQVILMPLVGILKPPFEPLG